MNEDIQSKYSLQVAYSDPIEADETKNWCLNSVRLAFNVKLWSHYMTFKVLRSLYCSHYTTVLYSGVLWFAHFMTDGIRNESGLQTPFCLEVTLSY